MKTRIGPEPNTGYDGCQYVICDVDHCPVCGVAAAWSNNGERRPVSGGPTCEALCSYGDGDELIAAVLQWTCQRCGARWLHGQFRDAEGKDGAE